MHTLISCTPFPATGRIPRPRLRPNALFTVAASTLALWRAAGFPAPPPIPSFHPLPARDIIKNGKGGDLLNKAYYWYRPHPYFGELCPGKVLNVVSAPNILRKYPYAFQSKQFSLMVSARTGCPCSMKGSLLTATSKNLLRNWSLSLCENFTFQTLFPGCPVFTLLKRLNKLKGGKMCFKSI